MDEFPGKRKIDFSRVAMLTPELVDQWHHVMIDYIGEAISQGHKLPASGPTFSARRQWLIARAAGVAWHAAAFLSGSPRLLAVLD